jgi:hypothetical protein
VSPQGPTDGDITGIKHVNFLLLSCGYPLARGPLLLYDERIFVTGCVYRAVTTTCRQWSGTLCWTQAAQQQTPTDGGQLRTKTSVVRIELEKAVKLFVYHAGNHRQQSFCTYISSSSRVSVVLLFKLETTEAIECTTLQRHELLDAGFLEQCEAQYLHTHVFNE